jgi:hypothetical protein
MTKRFTGIRIDEELLEGLGALKERDGTPVASAGRSGPTWRCAASSRKRTASARQRASGPDGKISYNEGKKLLADREDDIAKGIPISPQRLTFENG